MRESKSRVDEMIQNNYYRNTQTLSLSTVADIGDSQRFDSLQFCLLLGKRDWSELKQLYLGLNGLKDDSMFMVTHMKWPFLNALKLHNNSLTQETIKMLSKTEWPSLKILSLANNPINDKGVETLLAQKLPQLQILQINGCGITSLGVYLLALEGKNWIHHIIQLNLNQNNLSVIGIKHLSKLKANQLRLLKLQNCRMNSEGIRHLCKGDWPNLRKLSVSKNTINIDATISIVANNWMELTSIQMIGLSRYPNDKCSNPLHIVKANWRRLPHKQTDILNFRNPNINKQLKYIFKEVFSK